MVNKITFVCLRGVRTQLYRPWRVENQNKDWFKNWKLYGVLKLPFCDYRAINYLQMRVCFTNPCQSPLCVFCHSWIPPQDTCISPPVAMHCHLLVACISLIFRRDIIPRSFKCWLSFALDRRQLKTDHVHVEDPVPKMKAVVKNHPQKSNGWSCSF